MASNVSSGAVVFDRTTFTEQCRLLSSNSLRHVGSMIQKIDLSNVHIPNARLSTSSERSWLINMQPYSSKIFRKPSIYMGMKSSKAKEYARNSEDHMKQPSEHLGNKQVGGAGTQLCDQVIDGRNSTYSIAYNDAKYVNERARNDIILLSRGITLLNDRARQDVAVIGLGILKLDARAREDTEKIDHGMKRKAARLHHITTILKDRAKSKLKRAADQHWSDGALEADLRRIDFIVRRRAMEDAYMALKFMKNIHDMMASKLYQLPQKEGSFIENKMMGFITLEKNGKSLDLLSREVSTDRISAIQDAYWSMASALCEADGIDYTDPEELEMLVAALIDLDAMDGKGSASLLAECSNSPDVSTRQALANALAAAPSLWILGNAGMGALQRLAQDSNPAIAVAASKAIDELKQQWELEEGDSLRFMMNNKTSQQQEEEPESGNGGRS